MSDLQKCLICKGQKKIIGMGYIETKCENCHGVGWIEADDEKEDQKEEELLAEEIELEEELEEKSEKEIADEIEVQEEIETPASDLGQIVAEERAALKRLNMRRPGRPRRR